MPRYRAAPATDYCTRSPVVAVRFRTTGEFGLGTPLVPYQAHTIPDSLAEDLLLLP
jgi:hypothetical protein